MTSHEQYVYELTYSIAGTRPEAYEEWIQNATEEWITTERLDGLRCEQNLMGSRSHVRLVFEFETLADWAVFVTSETYRRHTEQLRTMIDGLTETIWTPTTIPLGAIPRASQSATVRGTGETR